ncbi:hypothetical protein COCOBI_16-0420 [Coccomyxa sp. Obi]|nr:hypothetical protein COCOBI_16-0420 [Coccomyxa sp. Obi]
MMPVPKGSPSAQAVAERASDSRSPPWIELPSDVWAIIGSHLGTKDLARASTVIKIMCGVQPLALNLAHTLADINKGGELVWGLKHGSRVLSAVIEVGSGSYDYLFECREMLLQTWSFPCIQELSLDVRTTVAGVPVLDYDANAFGWSLLAQITQLQVLDLRARELWPLRVMLHLRHLKVVLDGQLPLQLGNAVASIAALPALQTLYAEVFLTVNQAPQIVEWDLRTYVSLQAVCLHGMIPKEVLLPPAAKLTLDINASFSDVQWHRAHAVHAWSIAARGYIQCLSRDT